MNGRFVVVNIQGTALRTLPATFFGTTTRVDAQSFFSISRNAVYSSDDGSLIWQGKERGTASLGDTAGKYAVIALQGRVYVEAFR
jgi:hypothetical protein